METLKTDRAERARLLACCSIFAELAQRERQALADIVIARRYEQDEYLFYQEQQADGFFVVLSGKVSVHRVSADGREQVLHLFGKGDLVGEVPVFEGDCYPASAAVVDAARLLYVPREAFLALGRRRPEIFFGMLAVLSHRLRRFVGLIDDLSLKEVSARVAKYLLDTAIRAGAGDFDLDSTKVLLAARLGTIAETLSRTLKKMQNRKMIDVRGKRVTILDRDALVDLAAGTRL